MSDHGEDLHLPAVHALHLADLVKRWNVAPAELFAELAVDEASLKIPGARLSIAQVETIVARARALTGEPALGIHLGFQMRVSAHGYVGFAAMTVPNVREALGIAIRFAPTLTNALTLSLHAHGELASLVIEERGDLGTARDAILFAITVGIWQIANALTGRKIAGFAEFAFNEPPFFGRFAAAVPGVRFGQPVNRLVFDPSVLDLPINLSDPVAHQLAYDACERSLQALGESGQLRQRVRSIARKEGGGFLSLEEVASALHLSPRTLKRKLALVRASYSDVIDEDRREAALLLLRSALSLDEVAERLGYSDVANFSRAFRRWTGMSPGAYRRS